MDFFLLVTANDYERGNLTYFIGEKCSEVQLEALKDALFIEDIINFWGDKYPAVSPHTPEVGIQKHLFS